jgi:hypothetical protein
MRMHKYNCTAHRLIPLVLVFVFCFFHNSFSQQFERNGNIVTYRGNKFEYSVPRIETVAVTDPVTRKTTTQKIAYDAVPVKMNGVKIYNSDEVTQKPVQVDERVSLPVYVLKGLNSEFSKLPDGRYLVYVSNIIVDNKGKVVYYEYEGIASERSKVKIPDSVKNAIDVKIDPLATRLVFKPGRMNDKPVTVRTDIDFGMFTIVVKKRKATVTRS